MADLVKLTNSTDLPSSWRGPFDFVLENGLRVVFAHREKSPVVELRLVMEGGFGADPAGRSGLAALAMAMFSQGLLRVGDAPVGIVLEALGAVIHGQAMPDAAVIGLSALEANLEDVLRTFFKSLIYPSFATEDLEQLLANRLMLIAGERLNPFELALRVLPPMVYGRSHIYGRPFTGTGVEREVAAITCDDLRAYYATHLVPQCSTLTVAGSCKPDHLHAQLEKTFGQWCAGPSAARSNLPSDTAENAPGVVVANRSDASQATVAVGLRTVARNSRYAEALIVADTILGGIFTSRLNLSLRERKGWTYGVRSLLLDTRRQGFWLIRTAVRTDSIEQAMAEIASEIENLAGRRPSTSDEFARAVDYLVGRIPSSYETCGQMADALAHVVIYRLSLDCLRNQASRLRHLSPEDVTEICRQIVAGGGPRWLVVGEAAKLLKRLRLARFADIEVIESDSAALS
jgi:zinc protease